MIVLPSNTMLHDTEPGELKNFAMSHRVAIVLMDAECQAPAAATSRLVPELEAKDPEQGEDTCDQRLIRCHKLRGHEENNTLQYRDNHDGLKTLPRNALDGR
jgi:hypothetical protein